MFLIDWWNSLGNTAQIFACMAIPATLVLLIQTVMLFLGMGGEGDTDTDSPDALSDADTDLGNGELPEDASEAPDINGLDGLRIFTLRNIIAFFVVFGWLGVVMDTAGASLLLTLPVSTAGGIAIMVVLALLLRWVMSLRSDGNTDNANAIGTSGKTHLTIPPARSGEGKVHIMLQGTYVERNAVTDEEAAIPTGCEIVVVGISGQTDLVVRRK